MKINIDSRLYMKKPGLVFFVLSCSLAFMLLLSSCFTLLAGLVPSNQSDNSMAQSEPENEPAPPENKPEDLGWQIGQFTNSWGDKTDEYFMRFDKSIIGRASGFSTSGRLRVSSITFSKAQGLTFRLDNSSYDEWRGAQTEGDINIVLHFSNNEEITIKGKGFTGSAVGLPFSDELVNILSREENINFRITANYADLISNYQFDFKPDNFTKAYEELKPYNKD
jgi:hypothetical protein